MRLQAGELGQWSYPRELSPHDYLKRKSNAAVGGCLLPDPKQPCKILQELSIIIDVEALSSLELEGVSGLAMAAIGVKDNDILGNLYVIGPADVEGIDCVTDETLVGFNKWSDFSSISGRLSSSSLASLRREVFFSTVVFLPDFSIPMYSKKYK